MKFINNHGIEIILSPGLAMANGVMNNGEEISVKLDEEMAESINYLYDLDIFDLEKLKLKNTLKYDYDNLTV